MLRYGDPYHSVGGESLAERVEYDANGNAIYVGRALPGVAEDEAGWQIMSQTFDGSNRLVARRFAEADNGFGFVWADRATYVYG